MERLIKDANRVKEANGQMADLSIDSFADVVEAIHLVQEEMGITGTTAEEASDTISGSVSSMKAAWSNLVTGLADENADIEALVSDLVTTLVGDGNGNGGVINNILPRVQQTLNGIGTLVDKLLPPIFNGIPTMLSDTLPQIADSAVGIIQSLANGLRDNSDDISAAVVDVITTLINGIADALPDIVEAGVDILNSLISGIADNIQDIVGTIVQLVGKIVDTLTDEENVRNLIDGGLDLLTNLIKGIADNLDDLVDIAVKIIVRLTEELLNPENHAKLVASGGEILGSIVEGIIKAIPTLVSGLGEILGEIWDFIQKVYAIIGGFVDWLFIDVIGTGDKSLEQELDESYILHYQNDYTSYDMQYGGYTYAQQNQLKDLQWRAMEEGWDPLVAQEAYREMAEAFKTQNRMESVAIDRYTSVPGHALYSEPNTVNITQNIYSNAQTAADLMQEATYSAEGFTIGLSSYGLG